MEATSCSAKGPAIYGERTERDREHELYPMKVQVLQGDDEGNAPESTPLEQDCNPEQKVGLPDFRGDGGLPYDSARRMWTTWYSSATVITGRCMSVGGRWSGLRGRAPV